MVISRAMPSDDGKGCSFCANATSSCGSEVITAIYTGSNRVHVAKCCKRWKMKPAARRL